MTSFPCLCLNGESQEEHFCGKNNLRKSDTALVVAETDPRRPPKHSLSWPSNTTSTKGERLFRTSRSLKNTESFNLCRVISIKNYYSSNTITKTPAPEQECFKASSNSHILFAVDRSPPSTNDCAKTPWRHCENGCRKEIISTSRDEAASEGTVTNEAANEGTVTNEARSEETVTNEARSEETVTKDTGTNEAKSEETVTKDTGTNEAKSEETVTKDTGTNEAKSEETVTKDTVTNEARSEDTVTKDTVPNEAESEDTVTKDTVPNEAESEDTVCKDMVPNEDRSEDRVTNLRHRSSTKTTFSTPNERSFVEVADFGCQVTSEHDRLVQQSAKATQVNMYVPENLSGQQAQSNSTVFSPGQYFTTANPSPVCGSQKYVNLKYSVHTYSDQILVRPKDVTPSRVSSNEDLQRSISVKWRISGNAESSKMTQTLGTLITRDHNQEQSLEVLKQDALMKPSYEETDILCFDYLSQNQPVGKLREQNSSSDTCTVFGLVNTCEKSLKTRHFSSKTGKITRNVLQNGKLAPSIQSTTKEIVSNMGSSKFTTQHDGVKAERSLGSKWKGFPNEHLPAHEIMVEFPLPARPGVKSNCPTVSSTQPSRRPGLRCGPVKPAPHSLKPPERPSRNLAGARVPRVYNLKRKPVMVKQVSQSGHRLNQQSKETSRKASPSRYGNSRACSADVSRTGGRSHLRENAHFREWHGDVESEKATVAVNRDVTLQRSPGGTPEATTASPSMTLWRGFLQAFRSAFSTPSGYLHGCGTGYGSQVDAPDYSQFSQQNHGIHCGWRRAKSLSDINDHSLNSVCQRSVSDLHPQTVSANLAVPAACPSPPKKNPISTGQLKQHSKHCNSNMADKSLDRTSLNSCPRPCLTSRGPAYSSRLSAPSTSNVKSPTRSFSPDAFARKRATSSRPSLCSVVTKIHNNSLAGKATHLTRRGNLAAEKRQQLVGNQVQFRDF